MNISCPSETCSHASKSDTKARGTTWATTADDIYDTKQAALTIDSVVTSGSSNVITGGAVYDALQTVGGMITIDTAMSSTSTNPVQNQIVHNWLWTRFITWNPGDYGDYDLYDFEDYYPGY